MMMYFNVFTQNTNDKMIYLLLKFETEFGSFQFYSPAYDQTILVYSKLVIRTKLISVYHPKWQIAGKEISYKCRHMTCRITIRKYTQAILSSPLHL